MKKHEDRHEKHHHRSSEHGMRSATMPKKEFERHEPNLAVSGDKYATEFGNPQDLQRSNDALASYVKKHKMKY